MLSKRLRRRLRQIDDAAGPPTEPEGPEDATDRASAPAEPVRAGAPELSRRRLAEQARRSREAPAPAPAQPPPIEVPSGPLEELVPGEAVAGKEGAYWRVAGPAREMLPHGAEVLERFGRLTGLLGDEAEGLLAHLRGIAPRQFALLDTETAGLASAPIFLVGMIVWEADVPGEALSVQMFARDYAEERAVLAEAGALLAGRSVLITYNGRSFDLPMMRERMIYHALGACPEPATHLDLLHEVRARFRGRWEDCRLQTLEKRLCGRSRLGDIDGAEIPQAWHDFVHTGDAGRIAQIMEHNRLDLITMLEVLPHLRPDTSSEPHIPA